MRSTTESGYTLVEILVASLIGLVTLAMVVRGMGSMFKDTSSMLADFSTETDLYQLVEQVLRTGRTSDLCSKVLVTSATATATEPPSVSLKCEIKVYTDQPAKSYRFRKVVAENYIRFETYEGAIWNLSRSFGGDGKYPVTGFELCDFDDIKPGGLGCAIPNPSPTPTPQIGRVINLSGFPSRFFRFEIKANHPSNGRTYDIPSAFYVRNPPPPENMAYLWGAR